MERLPEKEDSNAFSIAIENSGYDPQNETSSSNSSSEDDTSLPLQTSGNRRISIRWNPINNNPSPKGSAEFIAPRFEFTLNDDDTKSVNQFNTSTNRLSTPKIIIQDDENADSSDSDEAPVPMLMASSRRGSTVLSIPSELAVPTSQTRRLSVLDHTLMRRSSVIDYQKSPMQLRRGSKTAPPPQSIGKMSYGDSKKSVLEPNPIEMIISRDIVACSKASSKGSSLRLHDHESPLLRWFNDYQQYLMDLYLKTVTFKSECLLMLTLLVPFLLLAIIFYFIDFAVLPDYYFALGLKVAIVLVGLLAEYSVSLINKRHADLACMIKIIRNDANSRTILRSAEGKGSNRFLKYCGNCCLT
jgi:hypothetical protein